MANEQIKFIVNALSKPPFSKSINLIKFDALEQSELVQILNDVLSYIEEQPTFDILHEPVEDTAVRFFEALKILRFKFPADPRAAQNFRMGLASGDKTYVYPVLSWLLERLTDLQKRAYLAKFLIHVYVPPEFQADPDVAQFIEK
uniref:Intraflagellar transport protein 81 homolog n=1 Tax=Romanomermis culicivorax TaxID=13658 RepID=A0A915HWP9_ROMCU